MNKVLLYLSSYIPLYLILIIKTVIIKLENRNWNFKNIVYFNSLDDVVLVILLLISIITFGILLCTIKNSQKLSKNNYIVKKILNCSSDSIVNYISIYILTFIDFNLNSFANVVTLIFIFLIFAIISIRYEELYINPTLLLLGYKTYYLEITNNNKDKEISLLIKRKYR